MNKKVKLVSLNMGISLVVLRDGKEQKMSYSLRCPSKSVKSVMDAFQEMLSFVNDEFETDYTVDFGGDIQIAKPKGIKAPPHVRHEEFNKRIKELVS